jgi:hypothetical protein
MKTAKKTDRLMTISVDPKEKAEFRKAAKLDDRSLSQWGKRAMTYARLFPTRVNDALKGGGGNRTHSRLGQLAAA